MSEELKRCLTALYLQVPEVVALDVTRIVTAEITTRVREALAERDALAARLALAERLIDSARVLAVIYGARKSEEAFAAFLAANASGGGRHEV